MEFLKIPNVPKNGAVALVDSRCEGAYAKALEKFGLELILVTPSDNLYTAVACHPDMVFHDLGQGYMIYEPNVNPELVDRIKSMGISLIKGSTKLMPSYPKNISYNAARVGNFVFHNFKYTDLVLLDEIERRGLKKIYVKQGYSKCSISVVDENSIITSDTGIHKAALLNGIDSLLIPPQKNIVLKGLNYGFIGGCSGKISNEKLCVFGNIKKLEASDKIITFAEKKGVDIVSLGDGEVIDYGSLLIIKEK